MDVAQLVVLLLACVPPSECVRCFGRFQLTSGLCEEELGEVDEDDCCQNPRYGYLATDGVCHSCGPPAWSPWSSWSQCNVLCGDGVRQRRRTCFGIGQSECANAEDKLQTQACTGQCCDEKGWALWAPWLPCSVTCGVGGVRKRERACSSSPECRSSCTGSPEERESCQSLRPCPVHGAWSTWSTWSQCSGRCIDAQRDDLALPSRARHRSCSDPAPSKETLPPGNGCPGDDSQAEGCSELPNCPVDGGWGEWSPPGPCSVSCGEGLQLSIRTCENPIPEYGGRMCSGPSTRSSVCQSPCPVDGFWTGWSSWSQCSSSCQAHGQPPIRTRHRTCSNPAPSSSPPGAGCLGDDHQTETCNHGAFCPVDGAWSSWSPFTSCPVTCGVGLQVSIRACDSPPPEHGGRPCPGSGRRTHVCTTNEHCAVDGVWSEWSPWKQCKFPFGGRDIRCLKTGGTQSRERQCLHQAHNGSICHGGSLTDTRVCYDVSSCYVRGSWDDWEPWSLCNPACGTTSRRFRRRRCEPDYSSYSPTIGRMRDKATFFGTPRPDCGPAPDGGKELEIQPCINVPPCA